MIRNLNLVILCVILIARISFLLLKYFQHHEWSFHPSALIADETIMRVKRYQSLHRLEIPTHKCCASVACLVPYQISVLVFLAFFFLPPSGNPQHRSGDSVLSKMISDAFWWCLGPPRKGFGVIPLLSDVIQLQWYLLITYFFYVCPDLLWVIGYGIVARWYWKSGCWNGFTLHFCPSNWCLFIHAIREMGEPCWASNGR